MFVIACPIPFVGRVNELLTDLWNSTVSNGFYILIPHSEAPPDYYNIINTRCDQTRNTNIFESRAGLSNVPDRRMSDCRKFTVLNSDVIWDS